MHDAAREHARIGLYHLKEAMLDVLYQARLNNGECIKHITVYNRLELPGPERSHPKYDWRSPMTRIILSLLLDEG